MEKIEITDEMLMVIIGNESPVETHTSMCITRGQIASVLLSERAERVKNPGVWDGAPKEAGYVVLSYYKDSGIEEPNITSKYYTRELPKTRAREIAEKAWGKLHTNIKDDLKEADIQTIEAAILEAQKEQ